MRVRRLRKPFGLVGLVALVGLASCTLLNPLDYLQAGRDAEDGGAAAPDARATGDAASVGDSGPELPGCGPDRWSTCGVGVVSSGGRPGGAVFVALGSTVSLYATDVAAGTITKATCTASGCEAPSVFLTGETSPEHIAYSSGTLAWTTPKALRRLAIAPSTDAGATTFDTLSGSSDVTAEYPSVAWTDDTGAHACNINQCQRVTLGSGPARSPVVTGGFWFVAGNAIQHDAWNGFDTSAPAPSPIPGTGGAGLVAKGALYGGGFDGRVGVVATLRRDGGATDVVVADLPDDAGAPVVIATEEEAVVSIATTSAYVYWTTPSGLLRRLAKDAKQVTTVLHGLGKETSLAVSAAGLLAIVDRGAGAVLTFSTP